MPPWVRSVAPYVGAWIETVQKSVPRHSALSHPTWVRGLKLRPTIVRLRLLSVAPYVGAWIETDPVPSAE